MTYLRRKQCYLAIAVFSFCLGIAFTLLKGKVNFVVSDGRGYYVYLPTIFIDGDLNFENQIREHWDVDFDSSLLVARTETGLIPNRYPAGFALSLFPVFFVSDILTRLTGGERDGYSILYQLFCFAAIIGFGFASFLLVDGLLQRFNFSNGAIFFGVVSYWLTTNYIYYYFREPMMVHVVSTFWISLFVFTILEENPKSPVFSWFVLALSASFATICRPTNILVMGPFIFLLNFRQLRSWSNLLAGCLGLFPILIQMKIWSVLYGRYIVYSYSEYGFHWLDPHFFSTLFSSKHGLFFWSPSLLLAAIGLIQASRVLEIQKFVLAAIAGIALLWYANSSWFSWWFGDAFGARSFIELMPFFVFGLAYLYEQSKDSMRYRTILYASIILCGCYNFGLMALYISKKIPRADYLFNF